MSNIISVKDCVLWQRWCGKWDVVKHNGVIIAVKLDRQEAIEVANAA